jgi:hypothetical protein
MAMNPRIKRIVRLALMGVAGGAVVGLAHGCRSNPDNAIHGEMFPGDNEVRPVDRMVEVQAAAAARTDSTLNAYHFDRGAALNSLGRAKLDMMLRDDDETLPLVVYLDVRSPGGASDAHRDSVRHYLADRGVADAQLEFRTGPNLDHTRPARDGLRGLKKLEGPADDATAESSDKPASALNNVPGGDPAKK